MLTQIFSSLLDLLYPPRCPSCREYVEAKGDWCPDCLRAALSPREVSVTLHHLHYLDACYTVCDYDGAVQRLIRDVKFRSRADGAQTLARLLTGCRPEWLAGAELAVPVPLHADRLRERGFNQTELIFRAWATRQKLDWRELLRRTRATRPQWQLGSGERRQNIRGAFAAVEPARAAGRRILLVDDIITTGLTMDECARQLKKAGASAVVGLALASGSG